MIGGRRRWGTHRARPHCAGGALAQPGAVSRPGLLPRSVAGGLLDRTERGSCDRRGVGCAVGGRDRGRETESPISANQPGAPAVGDHGSGERFGWRLRVSLAASSRSMAVGGVLDRSGSPTARLQGRYDAEEDWLRHPSWGWTAWRRSRTSHVQDEYAWSLRRLDQRLKNASARHKCGWKHYPKMLPALTAEASASGERGCNGVRRA